MTRAGCSGGQGTAAPTSGVSFLRPLPSSFDLSRLGTICWIIKITVDCDLTWGFTKGLSTRGAGSSTRTGPGWELFPLTASISRVLEG